MTRAVFCAVSGGPVLFYVQLDVAKLGQTSARKQPSSSHVKNFQRRISAGHPRMWSMIVEASDFMAVRLHCSVLEAPTGRSMMFQELLKRPLVEPFN